MSSLGPSGWGTKQHCNPRIEGWMLITRRPTLPSLSSWHSPIRTAPKPWKMRHSDNFTTRPTRSLDFCALFADVVQDAVQACQGLDVVLDVRKLAGGSDRFARISGADSLAPRSAERVVLLRQAPSLLTGPLLLGSGRILRLPASSGGEQPEAVGKTIVFA